MDNTTLELRIIKLEKFMYFIAGLLSTNIFVTGISIFQNFVSP
jgi:hypothetical protein